MKLKTYDEIKAYYQGKRDAAASFSWKKGERVYVGNHDVSLSEAIIDIVRLENETMQAFSEGTEIWTD